jgi:hypothetical protein
LKWYRKKASIAPVPGGVGPMTILYSKHCWQRAKHENKIRMTILTNTALNLPLKDLAYKFCMYGEITFRRKQLKFMLDKFYELGSLDNLRIMDNIFFYWKRMLFFLLCILQIKLRKF